MLEGLDLSAIQDETLLKQVRQLLNLVEKQVANLRALQEENQLLRDEINHLKGEQGKPNVKANKTAPVGNEQTFVRNRTQVAPQTPSIQQKSQDQDKPQRSGESSSGRTASRCAIQRLCRCGGARYCGENRQRAIPKREVLLALDGQNLPGRLPRGYEGEFGPGVKAFGLEMYF